MGQKGFACHVCVREKEGMCVREYEFAFYESGLLVVALVTHTYIFI